MSLSHSERKLGLSEEQQIKASKARGVKNGVWQKLKLEKKKDKADLF